VAPPGRAGRLTTHCGGRGPQAIDAHARPSARGTRTQERAMLRRVFLLAALMLGAGARAPAQRPPNVVLVMMDDLGYGDLGSYGAPDVRTPNIDRLAREGVRLTDAYASGAVCTPTRAALVSGRYQQRVGLEWVLTVAPADRERGLPALPTSLPALLRASGYATALVGKWHLGWKPEFGPNAHGFDEFYGFLGGAHSYYTDRGEIAGVGAGAPDLYENTTPVEATGYLTDEITRRAVGFIARHADGPFFLEVAYNAAHWPFQPPDQPSTETDRRPGRNLRQAPDDSVAATRQDYVRMLERADRGVGEILAALDRRGAAGNTLVIFTNDNGGEWLSRNAPLFHRKGSLWEGGIRVPLILRWPAALPRGRVSGQVAITMDVTASILAAAGARTPSGYGPDGIDLLPILRGKAPPVERRLFWRWARPTRQQRAVRSGRWKLLDDAGQLLLFDVGADPGERTDLAARRPDLVATLKRLLADWEADVDQGARPR
jgi:arylsulfatase A